MVAFHVLCMIDLFSLLMCNMNANALNCDLCAVGCTLYISVIFKGQKPMGNNYDSLVCPLNKVRCDAKQLGYTPSSCRVSYRSLK